MKTEQQRDSVIKLATLHGVRVPSRTVSQRIKGKKRYTRKGRKLTP
jgi:hypothetical protein